MHPRFSKFAFLSLLLCASLRADSFTKTLAIDFFRDVPSRNLQGLAARSDGRLLAGPQLKELEGKLGADLLWCFAPTGKEGRWYLGTGPEGRLLEVELAVQTGTYQAKEWAKLPDNHLFALAVLPEGGVVTGGAPLAGLNLVREGQLVARTLLPADTVFDLLVLPPETVGGPVKELLVATGNPGRLYRIDLALFEKAGIAETRTPPAELAARGVTLLGEVRDRNLKRLARLPDGRVLAGSSPRGHVYRFPKDGGAPVLLMENRDAEVMDFLVKADGSFHASIVASNTSSDARFGKQSLPVPQTPPPAGSPNSPPAPPPGATPPSQAQASVEILPPAPPAERFGGRAFLVSFGAAALPEVVANRANQSFYQLAEWNGWILLSGGEQGDLFAYDPEVRMSLTLPGSLSAQLNGLRPLEGQPGAFLLLRNNPAGLSLLDFRAGGTRTAETRKLELGVPTKLGALRSARLRGAKAEALTLEARHSYASDELEGWSPWQRLEAFESEGNANLGWKLPLEIQTRYVRLRVGFPAEAPPETCLDKVLWFHTPVNRRPTLSDFRILAPDYSLLVAPEPMPPVTATLNQILNQQPQDPAAAGADKRKAGFLNSQLVPVPGWQVVLWTVTDPDGDNFLSTLEVRKDGTEQWKSAVKETRESFAQMDISGLEEGVYHTRLTVKEEAPRPRPERLQVSFETDFLTVDRSAPQILDASATVEGERLVLRARAKDAYSLLMGMEVIFDHGLRAETEQAFDGVRDSREEQFVIDVPLARIVGATQVDLHLYDANGNRSFRRLSLP